jgi:DedD protein
MAVDDFKGDRLRQRLVGGVALLVIGMIAWFWLLSVDSPIDPVSRTTQIPAAPEITPVVVPEPTPQPVAPLGSERDSQPALRADITAEKSVAIEPESSPRMAEAAKSAPEKTQRAKVGGKALVGAETFELDQHGLPVAWVVQVGLFSTQASADKIKAALQQHGFKAYTELYKAPNAAAGVKVFVGPKLSRERADEQKRAIDAALKISSMVVRFQSPQR